MGSFDSVGSLLADIANLYIDGLRILGLSDKRHWQADEHELLRALEVALDDAKKDFQELSPLVQGQSHYEHDRSFESIEELKAFRAKLDSHILNLRDWTRTGGPVNPVWVRDTRRLRSELHRAQCRAARRVFASSQESSRRCLGAFLANRQQRANRQDVEAGADLSKRHLQEATACSTIGSFERFGDDDIAFVCDYCDGHLVWEDLERAPTMRSTWHETAPGLVPNESNINLQWQATGIAQSNQQEKQVVFAPLAVANHLPPMRGDWQARLLCPLCEEESVQPLELDDEEDVYRPNDDFDDLAALQEHLEWQHAATILPSALPVGLPSTKSCSVM